MHKPADISQVVLYYSSRGVTCVCTVLPKISDADSARGMLRGNIKLARWYPINLAYDLYQLDDLTGAVKITYFRTLR